MQALEQPLLLRRAALTLGAALAATALWPQPAVPHTGHGPTFVSIAQFKYDPEPAQVATGDSVIWQWDGPDRNHSVTADDGSFDSDPGKTSGISHTSSDAFSRRFDSPGTFTYHCKVHSFMRGTVQVTGDPPPAAGDTTPPSVTGLRVRRSRRTALIRLILSEPADFSIRLRRGGRTAATHRYTAGTGQTSLRISIRKLKRGRYTVLVTAKDKAGNSSAPARASLRIP